MTEREPFAKIIHDGNSWMVFVGDDALDGNPFKGISWKSKVEKINAAFNKRLDEELSKAREEDRQRIVQLLCEKAEWETKAKQRFALRAEFETALGFNDGETYDDCKFKKAVEMIKSLVKARKEWERGK